MEKPRQKKRKVSPKQKANLAVNRVTGADRSPERQREISRNAGIASVASPKGRLARFLRVEHRKHNPLTPEVQDIVDMIRDPECNAADIFKQIRKVERMQLTPKQRIELINAMTSVYKAVHGDRKHIETTGHTTSEVRVAEIIKVVKQIEEEGDAT